MAADTPSPAIKSELHSPPQATGRLNSTSPTTRPESNATMLTDPIGSSDASALLTDMLESEPKAMSKSAPHSHEDDLHLQRQQQHRHQRPDHSSAFSSSDLGSDRISQFPFSSYLATADGDPCSFLSKFDNSDNNNIDNSTNTANPASELSHVRSSSVDIAWKMGPLTSSPLLAPKAVFPHSAPAVLRLEIPPRSSAGLPQLDTSSASSSPFSVVAVAGSQPANDHALQTGSSENSFRSRVSPHPDGVRVSLLEAPVGPASGLNATLSTIAVAECQGPDHLSIEPMLGFPSSDIRHSNPSPNTLQPAYMAAMHYHGYAASCTDYTTFPIASHLSKYHADLQEDALRRASASSYASDSSATTSVSSTSSSTFGLLASEHDESNTATTSFSSQLMGAPAPQSNGVSPFDTSAASTYFAPRPEGRVQGPFGHPFYPQGHNGAHSFGNQLADYVAAPLNESCSQPGYESHARHLHSIQNTPGVGRYAVYHDGYTPATTRREMYEDYQAQQHAMAMHDAAQRGRPYPVPFERRVHPASGVRAPGVLTQGLSSPGETPSRDDVFAYGPRYDSPTYAMREVPNRRHSMPASHQVNQHGNAGLGISFNRHAHSASPYSCEDRSAGDQHHHLGMNQALQQAPRALLLAPTSDATLRGVVGDEITPTQATFAQTHEAHQESVGLGLVFENAFTVPGAHASINMFSSMQLTADALSGCEGPVLPVMHRRISEGDIMPRTTRFMHLTSPPIHSGVPLLPVLLEEDSEHPHVDLSTAGLVSTQPPQDSGVSPSAITPSSSLVSIAGSTCTSSSDESNQIARSPAGSTKSQASQERVAEMDRANNDVRVRPPGTNTMKFAVRAAREAFNRVMRESSDPTSAVHEAVEVHSAPLPQHSTLLQDDYFATQPAASGRTPQTVGVSKSASIRTRMPGNYQDANGNKSRRASAAQAISPDLGIGNSTARATAHPYSTVMLPVSASSEQAATEMSVSASPEFVIPPYQANYTPTMGENGEIGPLVKLPMPPAKSIKDLIRRNKVITPNPAVLRAAPEDKLWPCAFEGCTRAFKRQEHKRRHERSHTEEKPFQCDVEGCGRFFSRSDNLTQHKRTHQSNGRTRKATNKSTTASISVE